MWRPVCQVALYAPSLSITYALDCGTILMFKTTIKIKKSASKIKINPPKNSIVISS